MEELRVRIFDEFVGVGDYVTGVIILLMVLVGVIVYHLSRREFTIGRVGIPISLLVLGIILNVVGYRFQYDSMNRLSDVEFRKEYNVKESTVNDEMRLESTYKRKTLVFEVTKVKDKGIEKVMLKPMNGDTSRTIIISNDEYRRLVK